MARLAWSGALIVLAAGCGAPAPAPNAPAPSQKPESGGVEASPAGDHAARPSAPAEASEPSEPEPVVPRAKVLGVRPVDGTPGDVRVKISFENPTQSSCTFPSYVLVWPGGRKTAGNPGRVPLATARNGLVVPGHALLAPGAHPERAGEVVGHNADMKD